ncbi:Hypothetical predicted protein [Octopus vulgaris]|uniref:Uncharacterized protein n=1 Tax=Octopus vulgaris TaxID=6645 RepID=A0AA36ALD2_OCTVU|nr:Hypothetical predicted protein [Octopus vulgaris]
MNISKISHTMKTITIVYSNVADNFSFLIDLQAPRKHIFHSVKRLKEYPKDADISLVDELLTFCMSLVLAGGVLETGVYCSFFGVAVDFDYFHFLSF